MQMQRPYSKYPSLFAAAFCLLLATALSGCASKNPLMEDVPPVAKKVKPETAPSTSAAPEPTAPLEKTADTAEATTTIKSAAAEPTVTPSTSAPAATANSATDVAADKNAAPASSSVRTEKKERFLGFLSPYRPDVQQGNFVSREMVAQLREGMTQNQVVFLLGTPLLNDVFHQNRWDYIFRMQKGNGEITTSNVTVYFENGLVSRFEGGGDLPTEADYLARIADKAKAAKK